LSDSIPLGKKEDSHLEFKGAEALKDPEKIAREVVAMLNAAGGEVWVGLREQGERAVVVEPIADPEVEARRLLDFLVDKIEPSMSDREVHVQVVDEGEGAVLWIAVAPEQGRRPYAFLKKGEGRHFVIRVGGRIRPMTREELFFREGSRDLDRGALAKAEATLNSEGNALLERYKELFWLRIQPVPPFSLDLDALRASDILIDPSLTKNRRTGENFFLAAGGMRPRLEAGKLVLGKADDFRLDVFRHDGLEFRAPLKAFHAGHEPGALKPLYWLTLLELPVSVFRLLSGLLQEDALWEEPASEETVFIASCAFLGLEGWTLRRSSPQHLGWGGYLIKDPQPSSVPDLVSTPLRFTLAEVRDQPDRCGFRLVRRIYEAFGYGIDDIPPEFDQEAGRLVLPE
jgi:hypothetical protein